jgi:calcyclin binding protein
VKEESKDMDKDPNAALMGMMKKLYNEGDDDMKKTIAQAWVLDSTELNVTNNIC